MVHRPRRRVWMALYTILALTIIITLLRRHMRPDKPTDDRPWAWEEREELLRTEDDASARDNSLDGVTVMGIDELDQSWDGSGENRDHEVTTRIEDIHLQMNIERQPEKEDSAAKRNEIRAASPPNNEFRSIASSGKRLGLKMCMSEKCTSWQNQELKHNFTAARQENISNDFKRIQFFSRYYRHSKPASIAYAPAIHMVSTCYTLTSPYTIADTPPPPLVAENLTRLWSLRHVLLFQAANPDAGIAVVGMRHSFPFLAEQLPLPMYLSQRLCTSLINNSRDSYRAEGERCLKLLRSVPSGPNSLTATNVELLPTDFIRFHMPVLVSFPNAIITPYGHVLGHGYIWATSSTCDPDKLAQPPNNNNVPQYDRVFSIAQFWGDQVYHGIIECLPRLMAAYATLLRSPEVKIHIPEGYMMPRWLKLLGFPSKQLVAGWVGARVAFAPEPSLHCGAPGMWQVNEFRRVLRARLEAAGAVIPLQPEEEKGIVIIRRRRTRVVPNRQFNDLVKAVGRVAKGLRVTVFDEMDLREMSLEKHLAPFYHAQLVIGVHGAGLSNIAAMEDGGAVLEIMVEENINICYSQLARMLGLKWMGWMPETGRSDFWGIVEIYRMYIDEFSRIVADTLESTRRK